MSFEPQITVVGNLVADPELKFTQSGAPVANFTIAATPRTFNRDTNQWDDGETLFMRCSIWRDAAENVAQSLHRGDRVVATGKLVQRSWESEGQKKSVIEMQVDEVGPSLRYASATVVKAQRPQQGQSAQGGQQGWGQNAQGGDPWMTPQPQAPQQAPQQQAPQQGQSAQPWGQQPSYDQPPF